MNIKKRGISKKHEASNVYVGCAKWNSQNLKFISSKYQRRWSAQLVGGHGHQQVHQNESR